MHDQAVKAIFKQSNILTTVAALDTETMGVTPLDSVARLEFNYS